MVRVAATYVSRARTVYKGWGHELIFGRGREYEGKLLTFEGEDAAMSMHFHAVKDETWYVLEGELHVDWIDTRTAARITERLAPGDVWRNPPLLPHRLRSLTPRAVVLEVSTRDDPDDNYRVEEGDSQRGRQ